MAGGAADVALSALRFLLLRLMHSASFFPIVCYVRSSTWSILALSAGVQAAWELRLSDLSVESFDDMNVINFRQIFADREFEPGMLQLEVRLNRQPRERRDKQAGEGERNAARSSVWKSSARLTVPWEDFTSEDVQNGWAILQTQGRVGVAA